GLWRRTTLEQYRSDGPDWEVLIDVDHLAATDGESWVWAGVDVIHPDNNRALVRLSRGGSDAAVVREFDLAARQFVADGFVLPQAKTDISWEDEDTVLVGTDFGAGSLTESGYPRVIKRWRRGDALSEAQTVFSGSTGDVAVGASVDRTPGFRRTLIQRSVDFFNTETYELRGAELIRLDTPTDASVGVHREYLVLLLKSDWLRGEGTYPAGALLITDYEQFLGGTGQLHVVFEPDARSSFSHSAWTRDELVIVTLADVASRVDVVTADRQAEPQPGIPDNTDTSIVAADPHGDEVFLDSSGFTTPSQLLHGVPGSPLEVIKSAPAFFDADDLEVEQRFVASADGTSVPYFVVRHRDSTGPGPTLLGGYGGFQVSRTPAYDGVLGRLWLARGGNYVMANIRGGGEYGPSWHQQAQRGGRSRAFEDFAAVATDLVTQGVTTVEMLGATGGSNGGLLMGVMLTRYPGLFGALVCSVPLLDMRRFHLLLAGASWVAEYGDPDDPADWQFLQAYSPYHNIAEDRSYPALLITTSTRDDRVHPAHARKMTAALEAAGHRVRYYENIEGGHAGAADNAQAAFRSALMFEFLWQTIGAGDANMPRTPR
ncbi:MAG TPA: prolyl oligopeptidase family serine peptidase, partial [Mycobacterium sp.]